MSDTRTIAQRVAEFLADPSVEREDIRSYLSRLADSGTQLRARLFQGVVMMAAMVGLFVVLPTGGLSEAEVLGLKVQRFSLILLAIPPAVAFMFLRCVNLQMSYTNVKVVYRELIRSLHPGWVSAGLAMLPVAGLESARVLRG